MGKRRIVQEIIRRTIIVLLGATLIVDSIVNQFHVVEFILGTIMVGLFPLDFLLDAWAGQDVAADEEQIKRLEEIMKRKEEDGPK